jgi:ComF family protein
VSFSLACAWLLDLVAPRVCMICTEATPRELCGECRRAVPPVPAAFEVSGVPVLAAARYGAPLDGAIHRLKYEDRPDLARPLARLLSERVDFSRVPSNTWLVPVPLHRERLAERGYNQSALVAGALARSTKLPTDLRALVRTRATDQQARLDREARRANVHDAFRSRIRWKERTVVLVDDVVTTGATAEGSIAALREAGAKVLAVVAIARAGVA